MQNVKFLKTLPESNFVLHIGIYKFFYFIFTIIISSLSLIFFCHFLMVLLDRTVKIVTANLVFEEGNMQHRAAGRI